VPPADDVRADVARELRRCQAVGPVDQAARRRAHDAAVGRRFTARDLQERSAPHEQEVATIVAWVDAGAPKGDDADLPAAPKMAEGWTIGTPDAIFTMDEEFTIPATGAVPYKYFRVPTGLTEDKWIQAIEIKPGARAQVHHVIAFTQPAGAPLKPGNELAQPTSAA